jgi:lactoylglutathione lyase
MSASLKFYHQIVGLPIKGEIREKADTQIVFLGDGETQVELIANGQGQARIGQDIALGFEVNSLNEMMAFVKEKGIAIKAGPFQPNPFVKFFYVSDPDGVTVQFVEKISG